MPKRHPIFAVLFLIGGLVVTGGLGSLFSFGNMEAGMSDGTQGEVISPTPLLVSFAAYFICGIIACFVPQILTRSVLAVLAHLAPFQVLWFVRAEGWPIEKFFCVIIGVIFLVYSSCWILMFSKKRDYVAA